MAKQNKDKVRNQDTVKAEKSELAKAVAKGYRESGIVGGLLPLQQALPKATKADFDECATLLKAASRKKSPGVATAHLKMGRNLLLDAAAVALRPGKRGGRKAAKLVSTARTYLRGTLPPRPLKGDDVKQVGSEATA